MTATSFGAYLRELRNSRSPSMTQEELANAIGRSKMTISQFEKEKNAPPQGELLNKIIVALKATDDEENTLRFLAAEYRKKVPGDIEEYFFNNPCVCKAIRAAKNANLSNSDWEKVILLICDCSRNLS
ncbi:MAG: helix-turn-helix domain-containing protein [Clostridia bacterium]|nr:helix-turn-helix domain-containing protein [Clostridia bacterium]